MRLICLPLFIALTLVAVQAKLQPGFVTFDQLEGQPYKVSYDKRSLRVNDVPAVFISGSVHPPRSTTAQWDTILQKAVDNGLNMVEVYVFWNYHEPVEGQYNFEGNANLTHFIQKCADHNLFVNLRIGPYVCAEWTYGGIPTWLGFKEDVAFRAYNSVWMKYMEAWFQKVVDQLEPFFPQNGGNIVVVQVENELHAGTSPTAKQYIDWCGSMANNALVKTPVPVIMCNGDSAPDTINTCNGNDCTGFLDTNGQNGRVLIDQPAMWTENEGGFQVWGGSPSDPTAYFWGRAPADISFTIARWFARGGSHMNYYMYIGGNHHGRWAGGGITDAYAVDVNICPDTLVHEPKYTHLGNLHRVIAKHAATIVTSAAQLRTPVHLLWYNNQTHRFENGTQQLAFVYGSADSEVTFIESTASIDVTVQYKGRNYTIPNESVTIVNADGTVEYNTAELATAKYKRTTSNADKQVTDWHSWMEPLSDVAHYPHVTSPYPQEQSSVTMGLTEYMFYETSHSFPGGEVALNFSSTTANAFVIMIDHNRVSPAFADDHSHGDGPKSYSVKLTVPAGNHTLTMLSETLGVPNDMAAGSTRKMKGLTSNVTVNGDLITGWTQRPQLVGDIEKAYDPNSTVNWQAGVSGTTKQALVWYRGTFDKPTMIGDSALLLNITGLGRGHFFVNGNDCGRYWSILRNDGSNVPTQGLYPIPNDWINDSGNVLVLGEITGASDPTRVTLVVATQSPNADENIKIDPRKVVSCPLY